MREFERARMGARMRVRVRVREGERERECHGEGESPLGLRTHCALSIPLNSDSQINVMEESALFLVHEDEVRVQREIERWMSVSYGQDNS